MTKVIKLFIVLFFFINNNVLAEEINCSKFDKLSKEYIKCVAEITKQKSKKVKEKVTSDENKAKISNIKSKFSEKIKKFKNSKTGEEFLKKN
tara:strand:- start:564 stop:839 length:276 start_codon:yes stop_codon:yes gene_type:complete